MYLTNVVCSAHLGCNLNLTELCYQLSNVRYDPARFSGLMWQHRTIGGNCLAFSSGIIQCQGKATSLREGVQRLRRYARILQKKGLEVELQRVKVLTASACHVLSAPLDFNALIKERCVTCEPELFPTANFQVDGITFSCFHTGKIIITGIKKLSDTDQTIHPTLMELELYTT